MVVPPSPTSLHPQLPSSLLRQPPTSVAPSSPSVLFLPPLPLPYSVSASSVLRRRSLRRRSLAPSSLPLSQPASSLRLGPPYPSLVLLSVNHSALPPLRVVAPPLSTLRQSLRVRVSSSVSPLQSLFFQNTPVVASSGALYGLLGTLLSELIWNWKLQTKRVSRNIDLVYGGGSIGLMGLVSQAVHDGEGMLLVPLFKISFLAISKLGSLEL
ncbi:hypothetical protein PIB30_072774 [Stylosanthes scabra]|uniref:Uncharacterized protein n=1 Tax=Stylosanthes scabra TaxID=79078 RepID=A0ABU6YMD5_9FABA|nr:hypothetical protein [Stylosanthes scabra]